MTSSLFDDIDKKEKSNFLNPLADRMRPESIDEIVGQNHILGKDQPLYKIVEKDILHSLIFHGPPGTGKSTLAYIITKKTKSAYIRINAVLSDVKELREAIKTGEFNLKKGKRTILFIDEIHRFNKLQQDALLPSVESGSVILIGSTTSNPYFYLNNALLSRVVLFPFYPISDEDIKIVILRAIQDKKNGLGNENIKIEQEAINLIVSSSVGDIRKALSFLELAFLSGNTAETNIDITTQILENVIQKKAMRYDGTGDEHYNIISAFIKSVRGSDPDAAIYYLGVMLESGEDPLFIARRLAILAAEDIGLAEPDALNVASSTVNIVNFIGMPEAELVLSECTLYLALCPKSNSATIAINKARKEISNGLIMSVPNHLKDKRSSSFDKKDPITYKYAHDYPFHIAKQQYLKESRHYYEPGVLGKEKEFKKRLEWIRKNIYK